MSKEYITKRIMSQYKEYLALSSELKVVNENHTEFKEGIAKDPSKYYDSQHKTEIFKSRFLDINFKLKAILSDVIHIKSNMYQYKKIGEEMFGDLELSMEVEEVAMSIEKELYKPFYGVVEGDVTELDETRKQAFTDMFNNDEIQKEIEKMIESYEEQ